jgi:hypothetical protein
LIRRPPKGSLCVFIIVEKIKKWSIIEIDKLIKKESGKVVVKNSLKGVKLL